MIITKYQKFMESINNETILGKIYAITNGEFVVTHDCEFISEDRNGIRKYKCKKCGKEFTSSLFMLGKNNKELDASYERIPCTNKLPIDNLSFREYRGSNKNNLIHKNCKLIDSSNRSLAVKCEDCGEILTQHINGGDIIKDYIIKDNDKQCTDD